MAMRHTARWHSGYGWEPCRCRIRPTGCAGREFDLKRTSALVGGFVGLSLLAVACDSPEHDSGDQTLEEAHAAVEDADIEVLTLARGDGWRDELVQAGADGGGLPFGSVVEIADDRETAERAWTDNVDTDLDDAEGTPLEPGIYADLDEVDLAQHAVVVWSSHESSSCPDVVTSVGPGDPLTVDVVNAQDFGQVICTGDQSPYRVLFAVDRDQLPDDDELPSHDVDDLDDDLQREQLVDLYPADF